MQNLCHQLGTIDMDQCATARHVCTDANVHCTQHDLPSRSILTVLAADMNPADALRIIVKDLPQAFPEHLTRQAPCVLIRCVSNRVAKFLTQVGNMRLNHA